MLWNVLDLQACITFDMWKRMSFRQEKHTAPLPRKMPESFSSFHGFQPRVKWYHELPPSDIKQALRWYRRGARMNHKGSTTMLGKLHLAAGQKEKALHFLQRTGLPQRSLETPRTLRRSDVLDRGHGGERGDSLAQWFLGELFMQSAKLRDAAGLLQRKRTTYQTAKTMAVGSGLMGGLFGPTGSDFPPQAQVRSKDQYIPTAAAEDVRQNRVETPPSRYSLTDLDLRVPSSTKLMGHLTRLQDELRGCISAQPLMPSDRLLDQTLQVEMPGVSMWSSSCIPNSESIGVGTGGSFKKNDRLNLDAKPDADMDLYGLESHLESSVARESLRYNPAWRKTTGVTSQTWSPVKPLPLEDGVLDDVRDRENAIDRCCSDIEAADFVALDLEFSGLFLDECGSRHSSLEKYFAKCIASIPQFLPLQLGICCARQRLSDKVWELRSHEFNLWPCSRRLFMSDFKSLRFLRENGFDFNTYLDTGFSYSRLPEAHQPKKARRFNANQLIQALEDSKVPLVVHNGFLDLLHLFHGFIGDLPGECWDFFGSWLAHFPTTFDTRLLAQEGQYKILRGSGLTLEALHEQLSRSGSGPGVRIECHGPLEEDGPCHGSSGHDALLTAKVFIWELDCWIHLDTVEYEQKKQRKKRISELENALLPLSWQEVHKLAEEVGVSIYRSIVNGRFGGPHGARRPLAEIRTAIVAVQYAKEVDDQRCQGQAACDLSCRTTETSAALTADLLVSHKVCKRFRNCLAVVGASPGHICLDAIAAAGMAKTADVGIENDRAVLRLHERCFQTAAMPSERRGGRFRQGVVRFGDLTFNLVLCTTRNSRAHCTPDSRSPRLANYYQSLCTSDTMIETLHTLYEIVLMAKLEIAVFILAAGLHFLLFSNLALRRSQSKPPRGKKLDDSGDGLTGEVPSQKDKSTTSPSATVQRAIKPLLRSGAKEAALKDEVSRVLDSLKVPEAEREEVLADVLDGLGRHAEAELLAAVRALVPKVTTWRMAEHLLRFVGTRAPGDVEALLAEVESHHVDAKETLPHGVAVSCHQAFHRILDTVVKTDVDRCWDVLKRMEALGLSPNNVTCSILLKGVQKGMQEGYLQKVMKIIDAREVKDMDEVLLGSLYEACIRCGQVQYLLNYVKRLREESGFVQVRSAHTVGSIIRAYGAAEDVDGVWATWNEMKRKQIQPTRITLGCMVEALASNNDAEGAYEIIQQAT
eukprot:s3647_g1.t1